MDGIKRSGNEEIEKDDSEIGKNRRITNRFNLPISAVKPFAYAKASPVPSAPVPTGLALRPRSQVNRALYGQNQK